MKMTENQVKLLVEALKAEVRSCYSQASALMRAAESARVQKSSKQVLLLTAKSKTMMRFAATYWENAELVENNPEGSIIIYKQMGGAKKRAKKALTDALANIQAVKIIERQTARRITEVRLVRILNDEAEARLAASEAQTETAEAWKKLLESFPRIPLNPN